MKKILFVLFFLLTLTGCNPLASLMVKDERAVDGPVIDSTKATIVFIRPGVHGELIDSAVFRLTDEGEEFVGKVGYEEGVSVSVEPGEHLFMAVNQNIKYPRLMKAQVEAGKTYYAVVSPRGWPMIIFALIPVKSDEAFKFSHKDLPDWLAETSWVKKLPEADEWFNTAKPRVHEARIAAYNDWLSSGQNMQPQFLLGLKDAFAR